MHDHKRAIEAIVMVSDEPADPRLLAQLIEIPATRVDELCAELAAEYDAQERGFAMVKVAGGWRFQSRADLSPYVERFVLTGQSARLSAAALETLAIVAYKQPISRAQVAAIRGVSVDGVMRTLHQRGYIAELARDPGPGQAVLFGTTSLFLERLGLNSLDELPSLGDFVPGPDVIEALETGLRVGPDGADEAAVSEVVVSEAAVPAAAVSEAPVSEAAVSEAAVSEAGVAEAISAEDDDAVGGEPAVVDLTSSPAAPIDLTSEPAAPVDLRDVHRHDADQRASDPRGVDLRDVDQREVEPMALDALDVLADD